MPARALRACRQIHSPTGRRNFVYALPPERLSAAATVVRDELRLLAYELIDSGAWSGVRRVEEAGDRAGRGATASRVPAAPARTRRQNVESEALAT